MLRRIMPALAAAGLLLAACSGGAPAETDPKEIVTQGLEATADLSSAHIVLTLDGTATLAELGGEMTLDGTRLEGDVDIANQEGHLTFTVPPLFGMTGEVIQIGEDSYVKTSITGDTWSHSAVSADDPMSGAVDPAEGLDELSAFLDEEGVEVEKLDDTACGESTCHAVRLTIPAELLSDVAEGQSMNPTELVGESLVLDLYFDQEDQWLTGMSTQVSAESVGELTLSVTLSAFNEPVDVEAPPADEVTEGGGDMLPF